MDPIYIPNRFEVNIEMARSLPWEDRVNARRECFMSETPREYTYGAGRGVRTYISIPMVGWISDIMRSLGNSYNVCFLNWYENERNSLGWHADDSPRTNSKHPISVVSMGEAREIMWREKREGSPIFSQLLENGSQLIMPAGFQENCFHRIGKGSRKMKPRASATFREILD